ncbi:MAG TPA: sigma-54 dependent transcriptional regulator [Candidatus Acidoferrales bacterium]|nr:sigma-54 dependent transcriptional regulator [Candidatus Acidoferrales bacterium]
MNNPIDKRVLIVDDEERIRNILAAILKDENYEVATANDGTEALNKMADFMPHVAIVDLQMPRMNGLETISQMMQIDSHIVPIILTAHGTIQSAVRATKHGVYDYLTKPFDNEQMLLVVKRALEHYQLAAEITELRKELSKRHGLDSIVGNSLMMQKVREEIKRIAETDAVILIEGESGTGKELAAHAIHYESARKNGPMVIVDCGSIPMSIIESEFFGHEKGAFTDAREQRIGKFEEADTGTIFLDEISELAMDAQTKLLRFLQEKEFARVGGGNAVKVDVRVIAATNRNLEDLLKAGRFREDLYYRLNVLRLRIPSLREHKEDIPLYAAHFIEKHKQTVNRGECEISSDAIQVLMSHDWGGNVRELENAIQRAMLSMSGRRIEAADLMFLARQSSSNSKQYDGEESLESYIKSLVEYTEREIIIKALEESKWSRTEAAKKLKLDRRTLFNKMRQYCIEEKSEN